ncbi:MAG TPA: hypothetical protein VIQ02_09795 [Jiangellaceae bacterium]
MLGDIASGNVDASDVLLLIAAITFGVAALLPLRVRPPVIESFLIPAGLCLLTVGWLIL